MDLIADHISHRFDALEVLDDVSFTVSSGEVVAIVGPSGCGKSTLLQILGGLLQPSAGQAELRGAPPPDSLNPLTFVFQDFALLPWCTVEENVEFVLLHTGLVRSRARRHRRRCPAPHRPHRFSRRLAEATLRRHAPARRHRARARGAAGDPSDGRAAVGAGFADPRIADGRFYPPARRRRHGRGLCDAQSRGSRSSRRPHRRAVPPPRTGPRGRQHPPHPRRARGYQCPRPSCWRCRASSGR